MKMMNMQATGLSTSGWDRPFGLGMWVIACRVKRYLPMLLSALWLGSCSAQSAPSPRKIALQQQWTLNPGDEIAGSAVTGSLGDVSLHISGKQVRAPFEGEVELSELDGCTLYSSPDIPAYLFRFCGLRQVRYGDIKAGKPIGKGDYLSFATLRRQPDGTWIIVEPARDVLEKALSGA
ncbi:MAG: hypothetical protein AAGN15_15555 [Cyanobacteria bacterium J06581_3]